MKILPETPFVDLAVVLAIDVADCLSLAYKGSVTKLESVLYHETARE